MGYFYPMESLGPKLRKRRRRLGLTLDELAARVHVSKPYLSLIENQRVANPPSDEKLLRLEQTLGFATGELLTQAHLQRTPKDVREILGRLLRSGGRDARHDADLPAVMREMVAAGREAHRIMGNAVPVVDPKAAGTSREFLSCPEIGDQDVFAARVEGDSMIPRYRQGDIVIFAPSLPARDGDDCFVRFGDGQTTFKRIFFEADGEAPAGMVRLQPRNERYRPTVVKSDDVAGIFRAVYRYQRVDGE